MSIEQGSKLLQSHKPPQNDDKLFKNPKSLLHVWGIFGVSMFGKYFEQVQKTPKSVQ